MTFQKTLSRMPKILWVEIKAWQQNLTLFLSQQLRTVLELFCIIRSLNVLHKWKRQDIGEEQKN